MPGRRRFLQSICGWGLIFTMNKGDGLTIPQPSTLSVAVVQLRSRPDLDDNVRRHCDYIHRCAHEGARVVVFPECSVTGYFEDLIVSTPLNRLIEAEKAIAHAAAEAQVYAIVGIPTRQGDLLFNSAVVFGPDGEVVERYHKIQVTERWARPGDHIGVFPIDGVPCCLIICHDERYPELVRLPVLAGAKVVFYISHESNIIEEQKLAPYRAQVMARAVENTVYVVHANAPRR